MAVTSFQDLPLADRDHAWDAGAADERVRRWAGATDEPKAAYRDAHLWYDADAKDSSGSYKLPIADVIGGSLHAVPHAIFAAAAVLQGSRGGVDLPKKDVTRVKGHLAKYYAKLGDTPPWDRD